MAAGSKIPSLDGLRAISIAIVFWGHAGLPRLIGESAGVTIFFFLSGYLITTLLRREADVTGTVSLRDFYLRRALRIFPPLYIVLGVAVVLSMTGVLANQMSGGGVAAAGAFFTNYWIILVGRDGLPAAMNALWSLAVEEHFYLLFPFVYLALRRFLPSRRHQAMVLAGSCAAVMVWRCALVATDAGFDRVYLATDTRADSILFGSLLAIAWNPARGEASWWPSGRRGAALLVGCAALFWVAQQAAQVVALSVGFTLQGLALMGIFAAVINDQDSVAARVLNWRPLAFVGLLSYSLYLLHRPALFLAEEYVSHNVLIAAVVAAVGSLAISYFIYRLVELPAARARRCLSHTGVPPGQVEKTGDTLATERLA